MTNNEFNARIEGNEIVASIIRGYQRQIAEAQGHAAALQERYDALMEGLGLDPSPECMDEYPAGRLKVEGYGLRGRVERLEIELDEAHAERDALSTAAKTLQRVQFILGGHSGIIADCTDENVRENVERALSLMREKVPPMIDALRAAAQDGRP